MPEKTVQKEPGKKPAPSKKPKPQQEVVVQIPLSELHPFPDHPFQVREDTQLFNLLCEKADDVYGGRLPVHVRCLIDEAANIGQIPRLEKLVATMDDCNGRV